MKFAYFIVAIFLLTISNNVFCQSFKITLVSGSFKPIAPMVVGKKMELTLSRDSAVVSIAPLRQTVYLKQVTTNMYQCIDVKDLATDTYLLTVYKDQDQINQIKLKIDVRDAKGEKTEGWIMAKRD